MKVFSESKNGEVSLAEVVEAIQMERIAQDQQWGGRDHDDAHKSSDWATFISKQNAAIKAITALSIDSGSDFEDRMVKIAAIAVAAIQSNRRRLFKHHGVR